MEEKIEKFVCSGCDGNGYISEWKETKKETCLEIFDCVGCDGKGFNMVKVVDKRDKSKKKKLEYEKKY